MNVVSYAALALRTQAANDTTWVKINNIPQSILFSYYDDLYKIIIHSHSHGSTYTVHHELVSTTENNIFNSIWFTSELPSLSPSLNPYWPTEVCGIPLALSRADSVTHGSFPLDFFQAHHEP